MPDKPAFRSLPDYLFQITLHDIDLMTRPMSPMVAKALGMSPAEIAEFDARMALLKPIIQDQHKLK
jgi:hypothetical protein